MFRPSLPRLLRLPPSLRTRHAPDPRDPFTKPPRTTFGNVLLLAQIGLFYHLTTSYLYSITPTRGISMLPTMPARGSWSLCSHLYRHGKNIKVGDVIVFDHPIIAGGRAAKRVIGLEGDFVCVITPGKQREGEDEELSATRTVVTHEMVQVPKGHCWVEGDNLDWSRDSRVYGAVPLNLVRSKVVACVWPPGEWKGAENGLQDVDVEGGGREHETKVLMQKRRF